MDDLSERHDAIARELARFVAAPLSGEVAERIARELEEEPMTIGDRVLAVFSTLGAVAACVIAVITIWQAMGPAAPQVGPADMAAQQRMAMEYQQLFAAR